MTHEHLYKRRLVASNRQGSLRIMQAAPWESEPTSNTCHWQQRDGHGYNYWPMRWTRVHDYWPMRWTRIHDYWPTTSVTHLTTSSRKTATGTTSTSTVMTLHRCSNLQLPSAVMSPHSSSNLKQALSCHSRHAERWDCITGGQFSSGQFSSKCSNRNITRWHRWPTWSLQRVSTFSVNQFIRLRRQYTGTKQFVNKTRYVCSLQIIFIIFILLKCYICKTLLTNQKLAEVIKNDRSPNKSTIHKN